MEPPDHDYECYIRTRTDWIKDKENDPKRFVPMNQREDRTVLSAELVQDIEIGKLATCWRGVGVCKDPLDLIIYQSMLWDIKPKTIIEIGSLQGGTALWMADMMKVYTLPCHIYSMDIISSMVDETARRSKDITFFQGDSFKIEKTFTPEMLKKLPHPWMVIEDAHVNLKNVLEYIFTYLVSGDYLIVEDGNPTISENCVEAITTGKGNKWGGGKIKKIREFAEKHPRELMVDSFYQDRFGYNGSWNMNGYFKRM